jgi:acetyl esterase
MTTRLKPPFDLDRLLAPDVRRTPEMQAVKDWLDREDAGVPDWVGLPPVEGRILAARANGRWNGDMPQVAAVTDVSIPGQGDAPEIPAQLIVPPDVGPGCILYLHGGGWAFCDLATHQGLMRRLAIAARTRVLGVDYRRSPEHPFPAPLDDCIAAWRWLRAGSVENTQGGPLAVSGDSAGANLAIAVALNESEQGRPPPDLGLLFYGIYSADLASPSYMRFAEGYGLTRERMRKFWDWYAPPQVRSDPLLSPVEATQAQLGELPPLYLNAAGLDPLLSDSLVLIEKLEAAGVDYAFDLHEGLHHGFMLMSPRLPAADSAIEQAAAFYRRQAATQASG